jgi:hypothetical protein
VNAIPFRGDHRPAAQAAAYPPDYHDAFLQNGFAAHYIREPRQTPDIGQQQPPRGGIAPNPFTAPPLLATEPVYGDTEQERNFRALLNQGFGAAPVAQAYASVGGTGVPPSFAFGGPQVHTPGPPLRQGNPSPQGAGRLNPVFHHQQQSLQWEQCFSHLPTHHCLESHRQSTRTHGHQSTRWS